MAKDFRAGQVRTTQIIGSGSDPGKPSILIVSASDSPSFNGEAMDNSALLTSVGTDVFMFVTGSKSHSHGAGLQGVTLFGGDVVISGTMYAEHLIAEVEATTTGSLMVSGSLIVSQSATIHEGMVVNESGEGGSENDFRVESENKTHAVFVDASTDQVLILSGGGATSTNEGAGSDVAFYVSGSSGQQGSSSIRGTSVFGGDVVVSGSSLNVASSIRHLGDNNTGIVFRTDDEIYIDAASNTLLSAKGSTKQLWLGSYGLAGSAPYKFDQVLVMSGGGATSTDESGGADIAFYVSGTKDAAGTSTKGTSLFGGDLVTSGTFYIKNPVIKRSAIIGNVDGALGLGEDVNLWVSGAIGLTGTTQKGTAVFGGDVVVSGSVLNYDGSHVGGQSEVGWHSGSGGGIGIGAGAGWISTTGSLAVSGSDLHIAQYIKHIADDDTYIKFDTDNISLVTNGQYGMSMSAPDGSGNDTLLLAPSGAGFAEWDRVLIMSGGNSLSPDEADAADINFFVSGSIGSMGTAIRGTSVLGGDLVISGGLHISGSTAESAPIYIGASGDDGSNNPMIELRSDKEAGTSADRAIQISANKGMIHIDAGYDLSTPVATAGMSRYIGGRGLDTRICGTVATNPSFYLKVDESQSATSIWMTTDEGGIRLDADGANGYGTVLIQATTANDADSIKLKSTAGGMLFDIDASSGKKFHVDVESTDANSIHLDTKGGIDLDAVGSVFISGSQVLILSGANSGATSANEANFSDTNFFVSGTAGSRGTSTKGTSVFGGDVVISGSLTDGNGDPITGGVSSGTFNVPASGEFVTTSSLALAGGLGFNYTADTKGADAHFFVSGAIGKREDSSHVGTTIFGGDIVASGVFYLDNSSQGLSDYHGVRLLNDGTVTDSNSYFTVNMRPANNPAAAGGASVTTIQNRAGSINIGIGTGSLSQVPHRLSISEMGNSNNKSFLIASGAHGGQVLILSGGGATSANITAASDVAFYVSGTIAGKDTTGTAVFGGDVLTSGSLFAESGISGSLTTLIDGTAYLVAGTGITLTTGTNGAITIDSTAGGGGSDGAGWFAPSNGIITTTGSVYFGVSGGTTAPDITFGSDGAAVFNEQGASVDFRIESNNKENALFVDGSTDQVLILSGGGATSYNEAAGADVNFYVSGTAGSRGTSARGTTVFGGDAVISGALYVSTPGAGQDVIFYGEDSSAIGLQWDADGGDHGKLTLGQDDHGVDFQVYGEDSNNYINWQQASNTLSLYAPQGAINTKGNVVFDVSSQGWDFTVNTNNKTGIFVDGSEDQVLILSGGGATSYNEAAGADVNFYVSGTIGGKGGSHKGVSVFGGDLCSSGSVYGTTVNATTVGATAFTGSLTKLSDGTSYLIAGANVTITSGTNGSVTIASSGGGAADAVGWTGPANQIIATTGSLNIGTTSATPGDADIYFSSAGAAVFNEQGASVDFRVESDNKENALLVDGSTDQVLILSGGGVTSFNEASSADVNFYVSGSVGSQGTATRGTAVFGGDVVISGTLSGGSPLVIADGLQVTGTLDVSSASALKATSISGSITHLADGTSYLIAGSNVTITTGTNGAVTIASTGGGGAADAVGWSGPANQYIATSGSVNIGTTSATPGDADIFLGSDGAAVFNEQGASVDFRVESDNKENALLVDGSTDQVLILSGGGATSYNEAGGADVNFYVSGTVGSQGTSTKGTTVFGGDVVISGTLSGGSPLVVADGLQVTGTLDVSSTSALKATSISGSLTHLTDGTSYLIAGSNVTITTGSNEAVTIASTDTTYTAGDGLDLSGTTFSTDLKSGGGLKIESTELAIDDTKVATLTGSTFSGVVKAPALSGSLTHLSDGTSYLLAGTNVTITSGTNGSITVAAAGSGDVSATGSPANNQIAIWTDSNTVEGDSDLTFDGNTLTVNKSLIVNNAGGNNDFRVESANKSNALMVNANTDQVLILSGGGAMSYDEAAGADVAFYVSGTAGSKGTSARGTSVFGGDVCTSGTLYPSTMLSNRISGSLTHLTDGSSYLIAGSNVTITTGSSGAVTIASSGGGAADAVGWTGPANQIIVTTGSLSIGTTSATPGDADAYFGSDGAAVFNEQGASVDFRVESNTSENALLVKGSTDQVLILSGGGATGTNEANGADVNFFVSGTVGSKDSSVRGTSLFGGDLTISGTIAAGMAGSQTAITTYGNIIPATNNTYDLGSSANRFQNIYTGDLHLRNERGDWTIVEEEDYLCVVNNKSGQKFKMALIPIEE